MAIICIWEDNEAFRTFHHLSGWPASKNDVRVTLTLTLTLMLLPTSDQFTDLPLMHSVPYTQLDSIIICGGRTRTPHLSDSPRTGQDRTEQNRGQAEQLRQSHKSKVKNYCQLCQTKSTSNLKSEPHSHSYSHSQF